MFPGSTDSDMYFNLMLRAISLVGHRPTTNKSFHHEKSINDGLRNRLLLYHTNKLLLEHKHCKYCQLNFVPDGIAHTRNEDICQEYLKRKESEFFSFGRKKTVYAIIMKKKEAMNWKDSKEGWREERKRVNDVIIL